MQAPPGQASGDWGWGVQFSLEGPERGGGAPAVEPEGPRVRRGLPAPCPPPSPAVPSAGTMVRQWERGTGRRAPGFPEKEKLKSPAQTVICM